MFRKLLLSAVLIAASGAATADPITTFSEGFQDVSALAGSGWLTADQSTPGGVTGWFQGNSGIFGAESGAADSYIAANYLGAGFGGNIDNWLITPVFSVYAGSVVSFSTRTEYPEFGGDNLQVLYSLGGSAFTDFSAIDQIFSGGYPTDWTNYSYTAYDAANIRLAFRYLVTDTSVNGNYIGIDSFQVTAVPEPGTIAMFGAAFAMMFVAIRRRRGQV